MPDSFWNKVLWTDESKFNVKRSDGRIRVWRSSKNCLENGTTVRTFKHGNGSVMVWGCMSAAVVICRFWLIFISTISEPLILFYI